MPKRSPKNKCRSYLKNKIRKNMKEYKSGRYSSRAQALAVSYSQVKKKYPKCSRVLRNRSYSPSKKGLKLLSIKRSPKKEKKYMATFSREGRIKKVHFGAKGYQNYGGVGKEKHLSKERKRRYIQRHKSRENWSDPTTPGALSRYILWNKPSFKASLSDYKRRFKL